jgi:hypothetical protein
MSLRYGVLVLNLTVDTARNTAIWQGRTIQLPAGTNVLFVDSVDAASGGTLVETLSLNPGGTPVNAPFESLAPLYSLSPEIVSFLQCDGPAPNPFVLAFACNDIAR